MKYIPGRPLPVHGDEHSCIRPMRIECFDLISVTGREGSYIQTYHLQVWIERGRLRVQTEDGLPIRVTPSTGNTVFISRDQEEA